MKKFASALAVAAALGAPAVASAQNVTLTPYLTADVGIAFVDGDVMGTQNDYDYYDSNVVSSVYGLRGSVDLGNGLKVIGNLEGDFNTATGNTHPAGTFRRAANVGLEGAFGRIEVGTKLNPLLAFNGGSFAMGGNSVATNTAASMDYAHFFTNKSITYTTKVGGLTAQLQYGFEDSRRGTPNVAATSFNYNRESVISGFAKYDFGLFDIGVAAMDVKGWESNDPADAARVTADKTTWIVGLGANIAGFKIKAAYIDNDDVTMPVAGTNTPADGDNTAWHLGVSYALTPQLTIGGDYLLHDSGSSLANLQARYTMAKNLMFYGLVNYVDVDDQGAGFSMLWGKPGSGPAAGNSETAVALGMVVSF